MCKIILKLLTALEKDSVSVSSTSKGWIKITHQNMILLIALIINLISNTFSIFGQIDDWKMFATAGQFLKAFIR